VEARRVERAALADAIAAGGWVPVVADPAGECLRGLGPRVLVDARMAKRNLGTTRDDAPLVIGLGPGFTAGRDVHAVVETHRGPTMGAVLWRGPARADTGLPTPVMGAAEARVLRAPAVGVFHAGVALGALVDQGEVVGEVGGRPVVACVGGLVRGLIADGVRVEAGLKLGDVDPRGAAADPAALSDKGRAVAAGVLEAVLVGLARSEA
jgi:xanthine dehydrogenase accessory factor